MRRPLGGGAALEAGAGAAGGAAAETAAPPLYDLFAICNHVGHDMGHGHYTSHVRHPTSGAWYAYDDSVVRPVPPDAVRETLVTPAAYLLLYRRVRPLTALKEGGAENAAGVEGRGAPAAGKVGAGAAAQCATGKGGAVGASPAGGRR